MTNENRQVQDGQAACATYYASFSTLGHDK